MSENPSENPFAVTNAARYSLYTGAAGTHHKSGEPGSENGKSDALLYRLPSDFSDSIIECKGNQKAAIIGLKSAFSAGSSQYILLLKILNSIGLTEENCDFIPWFEGLNFTTLRDKANTSVWISFGLAPHMLGMYIKVAENQLVQWNGQQILFGSSLERLEKEPALKKALWGSLKQLADSI